MKDIKRQIEPLLVYALFETFPGLWGGIQFILSPCNTKDSERLQGSMKKDVLEAFSGVINWTTLGGKGTPKNSLKINFEDPAFSRPFKIECRVSG